MAERKHPPHCLLVIPAGQDPPLDLLDGLRRREVAVREVGDAPSAMATLATPRTARPNMVVVVDPAGLRDADRLAATVRRYFPRMPLWRYVRGAHPPLIPWPAPGDARSAAAAAAPAPAPETSPAEPTYEQPGDDPSSLLTEEELAMLLDDSEWLDEADDEPHPRNAER